jgi:hypothetical protein
MPGWLGERLDVGYAIDVLHLRARAETRSKRVGSSRSGQAFLKR